MIWNRFFIFVVFPMLALIVVSAVVFGVVRHTLTFDIVPKNGPVYLYVEPGDSLSRIAGKAKQLGLVKRSWHFVSAARLLHKETGLKAGEYQLVSAIKLSAFIEKIAKGDIFYRKVPIAEGLSVTQIEALLLSFPGLDWKGYQPPPEGSLLPETYFYTKGETVSTLVRRMQDKMTEEIDLLWNSRAEGLPFATKDEALILASIVEKETAVADERPLVAAVFVNRLRRKMRLQSDPTVVYGLTYGEPLGRALTTADLRQETGYNTYKIRGLPPSPIANPGKESLAAVLSPANVNYLYFVADGTGGHAFARTLREHNRNVAKWRRYRATQKR